MASVRIRYLFLLLTNTESIETSYQTPKIIGGGLSALGVHHATIIKEP